MLSAQSLWRERELIRRVGWACVVLGAAQGIYQLGWALALWSIFGYPSLLTASYSVGSGIAFATTGIGVHLLRRETPDLKLLRWALLTCSGAALVSEGLYSSVWYGTAEPLWQSRVIIHFMRNITLDLWLPFAAALLSVGSARAFVRWLTLAMLWWGSVVFLFYWWDGRPPFAPILMLLTWLATVGMVTYSLLRRAPTGELLLLASALWVVLLVYSVFRAVYPLVAGVLAHPMSVPTKHLESTLYWLIGTLNDWLYNSTPFWLFFALHWQRTRAVLNCSLECVARWCTERLRTLLVT
ncbi:MAG: hypothetical protein RMJ83_04350 [Armatimonadota bacterium]|nr:hypothetical protein [Armatimonadota bacterium]